MFSLTGMALVESLGGCYSQMVRATTAWDVKALLRHSTLLISTPNVLLSDLI